MRKPDDRRDARGGGSDGTRFSILLISRSARSMPVDRVEASNGSTSRTLRGLGSRPGSSDAAVYELGLAGLEDPTSGLFATLAQIDAPRKTGALAKDLQERAVVAPERRTAISEKMTPRHAGRASGQKHKLSSERLALAMS